MRYRPSQARYTGGGQVKYLVYRSPQPLRTGHVQDRTRVRWLYFPASATAITVQGPQTLTMRTGRQVYGVAVHYRHQLRGTTVHRDQTTYPLPPRWAERTKVVALPQGAKSSRSPTSHQKARLWLSPEAIRGEEPPCSNRMP
jgi:hypothetical protein